MGFMDFALGNPSAIFGDSWNGESPDNRNYLKELQSNLRSQVKLMPELYAAESAWMPAWSGLALNAQRDNLFGTSDRVVTSGTGKKAKSVTLPGSAGLLSTFEAALPQVRNMMTDPTTAGLLDTMTGDAQTELGLGTRLDPDQMRLVQQSVRAGQADRGMGYGNADVYGEVLGASQFGQSLRNQRRAYAGDVVGLRQKIYGPAMAQTGTMMGISSGMGAGGPQTFNPESSYAGGINAGNQSINWQALQDQWTMGDMAGGMLSNY